MISSKSAAQKVIPFELPGGIAPRTGELRGLLSATNPPDGKGKLLARISSPHAGLETGQFIAPHGLAVDRHGDIYVGEVGYTAWNAVFPDVQKPEHIRCLQKFMKV